MAGLQTDTGTLTLPAGSVVIGKVGVDQTTPGTTDSVTVKSAALVSSVSVTRPNDTNAYAANDVIGNTTSAGGAVLSFSGIGPAAGGDVVITSATLEIDDTAIISGETSYNLYLHSASPNSNLGDNGAFDITSGDRATLAAKIGLGTPIDEGSTLYIQTDSINKQVTVPSGGALKAYLVTVGGYTPSAQRVYKVALHSIPI